jgi:hypothetical protein
MEEEIEYWKDIAGYNGFYQISSFGRVKSFKYDKANGRILKYRKNKLGYLQISISKNKKSKTFLIHRLVGIAFIPNPENKPEINHKDNDRSNNKQSNLEWNTAKQNAEHKVKQGRCNIPKGEKCTSSKLSEKQVEEIKSYKGNLSQKELGKLYGVSQANISSIVTNKSWKV